MFATCLKRFDRRGLSQLSSELPTGGAKWKGKGAGERGQEEKKMGSSAFGCNSWEVEFWLGPGLGRTP
eukprot:5151542-Pyramimonas_sp.AAC.1